MPLRIDHSSDRRLDIFNIFGINFADCIMCFKITEFVNERIWSSRTGRDVSKFLCYDEHKNTRLRLNYH